MVNLVAAERRLLRGLMKMAGIVPHTVEIHGGTVMNIWGPRHRPTKPVVVLLHGFAADGIVTWQFQVGSLSKNYAVYVPDLLFFGRSTTDSADRSPAFQAECLAKGLRKLGVERCAVVGFSYGGMVAFKMAEMWPELVEAVVASGSIMAMTESVSSAALAELGLSSWSELLLPTSVDGCKALLKAGTHINLWFPRRFYRDFLKVMFKNRKERDELLQELVVHSGVCIPKYTQKIHLLWGEKDKILKLEVAHNMKRLLGEKATFEGIKNAGHLVHLERPCVYNRRLNYFLDSIYQ